MRPSPHKRTCLWLAAAACIAGCWRRAVVEPPKPERPFAAARIATPKDMIPGPAANGLPGDYVLENELIRVIISAVQRPSGGSKSGGNIRDACDKRTNVDLLKEVFTYFADTFPRQAVYQSVAIVKAGGEHEPAEIRAEGVDCEQPGIRVATTYQLWPGQRHVTLTTQVANHTDKPLDAFALGDAIQWGAVDHFAQGFGRDLGGRKPKLVWLAGVGDFASYGMFVGSRSMQTRHGSGWSDVIVSAPDIPVGSAATYTRHFAVGIGGSTGISDECFFVRGDQVGSLSGRFRSSKTKAPIANAAIEIRDMRGQIVGIAKTDPWGAYAASLRPGLYKLRPTAHNRQPMGEFTVRIEPSRAVAFDGELGEPAQLTLEAVDEAGEPIPAKFTFLGAASTPTPDFGSTYTAAGARNVVFVPYGKADAPIAPGNYLVVASRGIEYTLHQQTFFIASGERKHIRATLRRVVPTKGYLAADLHQHTAASFDSALAFKDRVITDACEGVEVAAVTDHDRHTDLAPTIRELGLTKFVAALVGNEVTTNTLGHFNAYPMPLVPRNPRLGPVDHRGKDAATIFEELRRLNPGAIVQVNHPRAGGLGYFNRVKFDPKTGLAGPGMSLDFDAIEVLNGKHVAAADRVLRDWFALLNAGHRFTAVGGSDSHMAVTQEAGCPRTMLYVGTDSVVRVSLESITAAIKTRRRAIVTNGPMVYITVNRDGVIGSMVSDSDGEIDVRGRVFCAPWVQPNKIEFVVNGAVVDAFPLPETGVVERFDRRLRYPIRRDSWIVAVVSGIAALSPVYPDYRSEPVTPFAVTNPIWIDADGDGKWTPRR